MPAPEMPSRAHLPDPDAPIGSVPTVSRPGRSFEPVRPTRPRPTDHADEAEADPDDRGAPAPRRDPRQHDRLAEVGALRQRPGLGHRPRGLQRRRRGLGLPAPRPGPEQGLSLGRGRHRRLVCDRYQLIVFAPAFWNGRDPILKERLFGLSGPEGNHGEDVKEYYFYLDATPTHSYLRFLYKYPQAEFPYEQLIDENARRGPTEPEYELLDTGVFDEDRYFDIEVEYAKVTTEDIAIRIKATNRGPDPAPLHLIPHLWFRNTWSWGPKPGPSPKIYLGPSGEDYQSPDHRRLDGRDPGHRPRRLPDRRPDLLRARRAARRCSPTTRPTSPGSSAPARSTPRPTSRTPSTARSSTARTASTPTGSAPRRPSTTSSTPSRPASPSPSASA